MRDETRALLDLLLTCRHIGAVEPLVQGRVRGGFGREQKMCADRCHGVAPRALPHDAGGLARRRIVAEIDRLQMRVFRSVLGEPAMRSPALAVLLLGAVLGRDELRLQRRPCGAWLRHGARSCPGATMAADSMA